MYVLCTHINGSFLKEKSSKLIFQFFLLDDHEKKTNLKCTLTMLLAIRKSYFLYALNFLPFVYGLIYFLMFMRYIQIHTHGFLSKTSHIRSVCSVCSMSWVHILSLRWTLPVKRCDLHTFLICLIVYRQCVFINLRKLSPIATAISYSPSKGIQTYIQFGSRSVWQHI